MIWSESLKYFSLRDLGGFQRKPGDPFAYTAAEVKSALIAKGVADETLSLPKDEKYFAVREFYIPVDIFASLENMSTSFHLNEDVLNILQGHELKFISDASREDMRQYLNSVGLKIFDMRKLSYKDGSIDLDDMRTLAKLIDQSGKKIDGKSYSQTLEERIKAMRKRLNK